MGWVWEEDDSSVGFKGISDSQNPSPNSGESCSTRRIIRSKCNTEEVEPGKFVRKCEKTEEILKSCIGKPTEVVKSTTEYTEDDVSNEISSSGEGGIFSSSSSSGSEMEPFRFPGLRSDMEAIEKSLFGSFRHLFEAAEDMRNGFFQVFGSPESSPPRRRGIQIQKEEKKDEPSAFAELAGQMRDV